MRKLPPCVESGEVYMQGAESHACAYVLNTSREAGEGEGRTETRVSGDRSWWGQCDWGGPPRGRAGEPPES